MLLPYNHRVAGKLIGGKDDVRTIHGDCIPVAADVGLRLLALPCRERPDSPPAVIRRHFLRGAPPYGNEDGIVCSSQLADVRSLAEDLRVREQLSPGPRTRMGHPDVVPAPALCGDPMADVCARH